jgi:hypothetical protein
MTRGTISFISDNKTYRFYNHHDSYPDGLGKKITKEFRKLHKILTIEDIKKLVERIEPIQEKSDIEGSLKDILIYGYGEEWNHDEDWNYIFDLDLLLFKIFHKEELYGTYNLLSIPKEWYLIKKQ